MSVARRRARVALRRSGRLVALALCSLAACGDSVDAQAPSHVVATVSDQIATVVIVRWTTDVPATGYVEYGPTQTARRSHARRGDAGDATHTRDRCSV